MTPHFGHSYQKLQEAVKHQAFMKPPKKLTPMWPPSLYKHQKEGVAWMLKREQSPVLKGGLLCDEPGMGKTIQVGAVMCQNPQKNNLLILPNAVIRQWVDTLTKMIPGVNIYVHHGNTKIKDTSILQKGPMNIVIITIAGVTKMSLFKKITWDRIIMDECHYIKNKSSSRSIHAKKLNGKIKWGLTGTPVQNSIKDLISLVMFIKPDNWDLDKLPINKHTIKQFKTRVVLRRTKDDHPKDPNYLIKISSVNEKIIRFPFKHAKEREFYNLIMEEIQVMAEDIQQQANALIRFHGMLELLIRNRQASIHPVLYARAMLERAKRKKITYRPHQMIRTYDYKQTSSRFDAVINSINEKKQANQLVFCRYRHEMDLWEQTLTERGYHCFKYNGSTSMKNRQKIINSYTYNRVLLQVCNQKIGRAVREIFENIRSYFSNILLIQIVAGGTGLNLQQFTRVMLTTPDWNPCNEIQAVARSHRIGQTAPVDIYRFLLDDGDTTETIDDRIYEKQTNKRLVMADVLNDTTLYTDEKLSIDGIRELIEQKKEAKKKNKNVVEEVVRNVV
jgi:SNF2 family DNA or RNA helicase